MHKKSVLITELLTDVYDSRSNLRSKTKTETDIMSNKDWDTDLEDEEGQLHKFKLGTKSIFLLLFKQDSVNGKSSEEMNDTNGSFEYKKVCRNLNVVPCRYFIEHLDDQSLSMNYHQFRTDEIRAISKPLWV